MPLYEYTCLDCNETFDALRKFSEADEPIACLHCEGENTVRGLSTFAFHGTRTESNGNTLSAQQPSPATGGGCCGGGACGCAI